MLDAGISTVVGTVRLSVDPDKEVTPVKLGDEAEADKLMLEEIRIVSGDKILEGAAVVAPTIKRWYMAVRPVESFMLSKGENFELST